MKGYDTAPSGAVQRARLLRRNKTDAEKRLWRELRRVFPEAKFRQQSPVGHYYPDFLSFRHKLIVEVDGGQHALQEAGDAGRTAYLEAQGYRVIRFWNNDVLANTEGVLQVIAMALKPQDPHPDPLPQGEGESAANETPLPPGEEEARREAVGG